MISLTIEIANQFSQSKDFLSKMQDYFVVYSQKLANIRLKFLTIYNANFMVLKIQDHCSTIFFEL